MVVFPKRFWSMVLPLGLNCRCYLILFFSLSIFICSKFVLNGLQRSLLITFHLEDKFGHFMPGFAGREELWVGTEWENWFRLEETFAEKGQLNVLNFFCLVRIYTFSNHVYWFSMSVSAEGFFFFFFFSS